MKAQPKATFKANAREQQLTNVLMTYNDNNGPWSLTTTLPQPGNYDFYIVATENDGIYGKVVEQPNIALGTYKITFPW